MLKAHAPRWLASVLETTCTIAAIYQTLLIFFHEHSKKEALWHYPL